MFPASLLRSEQVNPVPSPMNLKAGSLSLKQALTGDTP